MKASLLVRTFLFLICGLVAASGDIFDQVDTHSTNRPQNRKLLRDKKIGITPVTNSTSKFLTGEEVGLPPPEINASDFEVVGHTPNQAADNDFEVIFTPTRPKLLTKTPVLDLQPVVTSAKSTKLDLQPLTTPSEVEGVRQQYDQTLAASTRRLEQFRQEQALEDAAWQLEQSRFQQENEAIQQRIAGLRATPISVPPPVLVSPPIVVSANRFDPNSLANPYGAGSPYKSDGLMNPYSQYGSPYSSKSWRNPYATDTPKLYDSQGNYAGKLSSNPYDPDSTANPYGRYGSPYSPNSVNNPYGLGNPYNTTPIYVVPSP